MGEHLSLSETLARLLQTLLMSFSFALSRQSVIEANWSEPRTRSCACRETVLFRRSRLISFAIPLRFEGGRESVCESRSQSRPSHMNFEARVRRDLTLTWKPGSFRKEITS